MAPAGAVRAQEAPTASYHELRSDIATDLTITGAAAAVWLGAEALKPQLARSACRWCDRNSDGTDALNSVDADVRSALRWSSTSTAAAISDVLGYGLLPGAALAWNALASHRAGGRWSTIGTDALLVGEALMVASALSQIAKFAVARERPFVHALPSAEKPHTESPSDNNLSFFSAHTMWAFTVVTASGTVASLRGYREAPAVWAVGIPLAATTGYLRIAADKHYLSDVIVGALAGTAIGVGIPLLFHNRRAPDVVVDLGSAPRALGIQWSGAF